MYALHNVRVLVLVAFLQLVFVPESLGSSTERLGEGTLTELLKILPKQGGVVEINKTYNLRGKDISIPSGVTLRIENGGIINARLMRLASNSQVIGGFISFVEGGGFYITNSSSVKLKELYLEKVANKAESLYLPGTSVVFCSSSSEVDISDCEFVLSGYACGVRFVNSSNVRTRDCRIFNRTYNVKKETTVNTEGLSALDNCSNVIFTGNVISDVAIGITVWALGEGAKHCDYCQIINNIVYNCGTYGIMAYQNQGSDSRKVIIANNQIRDIYGSYMSPQGRAMGSGIYLQGCHFISVTGNYIENTCILTDNFGTLAPAGIGCNNSSHVVCIGNNIVKSGTYAMYADGENNLFSNNIIDGAGRAGIYMRRGKNIIISNNIITGTAGSGIMLHATKDECRAISVTDNVVNLEDVQASSCISIDNVEDVLVNNNKIYSSYTNANAIYISKTARFVKVMNNTLKVNKSIGVNAIGEQCYIVGNVMDSEKARVDYSVYSETSVAENNYSSHAKKK